MKLALRASIRFIISLHLELRRRVGSVDASSVAGRPLAVPRVGSVASAAGRGRDASDSAARAGLPGELLRSRATPTSRE